MWLPAAPFFLNQEKQIYSIICLAPSAMHDKNFWKFVNQKFVDWRILCSPETFAKCSVGYCCSFWRRHNRQFFLQKLSLYPTDQCTILKAQDQEIAKSYVVLERYAKDFKDRERVGREVLRFGMNKKDAEFVSSSLCLPTCISLYGLFSPDQSQRLILGHLVIIWKLPNKLDFTWVNCKKTEILFSQ